MASRVLGISAYFHDSAACILEDGRIVAAAQEERFTRKKHDPAFPSHAVEYCLRCAHITPRELDLVGFYEKPLVKFERLVETYAATAPRGFRSYLKAMPAWLGEKLWIENAIRDELPDYTGDILFGVHHESHAASAFYPSPFEQAAILTLDGVGEWASSTIGIGSGHRLEIHKETRFPHSLGLFYSALTFFTGFTVNSGEYKLMGLAPYGAPTFVKLFKEHLLDIREDGSIWLNPEYFSFTHALAMTGPAMARLLGGPPRARDGPLTRREMDLARSVQDLTEEVMLKMARFAHRETGMRDLCLAGGVALNCVGNSRILAGAPFDQVWIQPAAGDAGGAIGVALSLWHRYLDHPRVSPEKAGTWERPAGVGLKEPKYADSMNGSFLGPEFTAAEIQEALGSEQCTARRALPGQLPDLIADLLAGGKVIGLFQGRMEFGPRSLGHRSIIADPRSPAMQSMLNLKVKFRESFRPFAPSVLREDVQDWFDFDGDSPYMLLVAAVLDRHRIDVTGDESLMGLERVQVARTTVPAVTHVDYSARLHTVRRQDNALFYDIIAAFRARTGCPMIVNTSFNVRGEPPVCTPRDAIRCFRATALDVVVLEDFILDRSGLGPDQSVGHLAFACD